jgi:heme oxygenase
MSVSDEHFSAKPPTTLMAMLKNGTADVHREIELVFPLLRSNLTVDVYRKVLARLYAFYFSLEKNYADFSDTYGVSLKLDKRRKFEWLAADLKGVGFTDCQIKALQAPLDVPAITCVEDLIGTLYVIEGATLGGHVIQVILKKKLQLKDDQLHYFNSYGSETQAMWQDFQKSAEMLIDGAQFEDVLTRAKVVFAYMSKVLSS